MRRILVVDDDPIRTSRSAFGSNGAAWLRSPTVAPTALRCATMQRREGLCGSSHRDFASNQKRPADRLAHQGAIERLKANFLPPGG
jgi:hypothetical protein